MAASNTGALVDISGYTVDFMEELGRGGFGTVYKGYSNHDLETVAMKKVSKMDRRKASAEAVRFHFLIDRIVHDNIIKVYDVKSWKDSMWIMMEFCDQGDLNDFFMNNAETMTDAFNNTKVKLMQHIADGIAFLHSRNIVHRDIKPGNLLVKTNNLESTIKLSDFGLSKILDPEDLTSAMSSDVGTLMFKAPEFWDQKPGCKVRYHRNVDVYSAGLTFTAMLQARSGRNLVPRAECPLQPSETSMPIGFAAFTRMNKNLAINVVEHNLNDDELTKQVKELIQRMTSALPTDRLSASEVADTLGTLLGFEVVATNSAPVQSITNASTVPNYFGSSRKNGRTRHNTAPACL